MHPLLEDREVGAQLAGISKPVNSGRIVTKSSMEPGDNLDRRLHRALGDTSRARMAFWPRWVSIRASHSKLSKQLTNRTRGSTPLAGARPGAALHQIERG